MSESRRDAAGRSAGAGIRAGGVELEETVALVAHAKRELLLRVHRRRLRREDLEDCFSQATLELIVLVRSGRRYAGRKHIANALEQRFLARVSDRRRALSGRSPMQAALEGAVPFDGEERLELPDGRGDPARVAAAREQLAMLREGFRSLTRDQQVVMAAQLAELPGSELCAREGWTGEKYRKVAQRARARLRSVADA